VRPLRYSINVTLDGCSDHRVISPDEEMHRHATKSIDETDALIFGRVTYETMEATWRAPGQIEAMPDWMRLFGRTIDAAKKYVVSSTLDRVDWAVVIPVEAWTGGIASAILIGPFAGLMPAVRASRMPPTVALRTV
jgi:hypothetical protein